MNFALFQENSFEMGEIMRALEEVENLFEDGESLGFVEDEDSPYYGSWAYVASTETPLDEINEMLTGDLGYDLMEDEDGGHGMYRMDTITQIEESGDNEVTFYIDHASEGDYDLGSDNE